jgi:hypothetical protein
MTFPTHIKLIIFILPILLGFARPARAQVITSTFACSHPTCLVYEDGTTWTISMEATAVGAYYGNGVNLDVGVSGNVTGCSFEINGEAQGEILYSTKNHVSLGIQAQATASVERLPIASVSQIQYLSGTKLNSGGGEYPC